MKRAYGATRLINLSYSRELSLLLCLKQTNAKELLIRVLFQGESWLQTLRIKLPKAFEMTSLTHSSAKGCIYLCLGVNHPLYIFKIDDAAFQKMVAAVELEVEQQQYKLAQYVAVIGEDVEVEIEGGIESSKFSYYQAIELAKQKNVALMKTLFSLKQALPTVVKYREKSLESVFRDPHSPETLEKAMHEASNDIETKDVSGALIVPYANRLWCFGEVENVHSIKASTKGNYALFGTAYRSLIEARNPMNALSGTFTSDSFDSPLWAYALGSELLLGTTDGIYILVEGDRAKGEFIKIHKELNVALAAVAPVVLEKTLFFVEGGGRKLSCLYYSREKGGYQVHTLSAYADHLFRSGIVRLVAVSTPFNMIIALLANGQFCILTYDSDLKLLGWSQHILGGESSGGGSDIILDCCVMPTSTEDQVFFLVKRNNLTTVEVLNMSQVTALKQADTHYLDGYTTLGEPEVMIWDKTLERLSTTVEFWEEREGLPEGFHYLEERVKSQLRMFVQILAAGEFAVDGVYVKNLPISNEEERQIKQSHLNNVNYLIEYLSSNLMRLIGRYYAVYRAAVEILNNIGEDFSHQQDSSIFRDLNAKVLDTVNRYKELRQSISLAMPLVKGFRLSCPALNINVHTDDYAFFPEDRWITNILEHSQRLADFMTEFSKDHDRKHALQLYETWVAEANAAFIEKHLHLSTPNYKMISRWNSLVVEEDLWGFNILERMKAAYTYGSTRFNNHHLPILLKTFEVENQTSTPEKIARFCYALLRYWQIGEDETKAARFTIWNQAWLPMVQEYFKQQNLEWLQDTQDRQEFVFRHDDDMAEMLSSVQAFLNEFEAGEESSHRSHSSKHEESSHHSHGLIEEVEAEELSMVDNVQEIDNHFELIQELMPKSQRQTLDLQQLSKALRDYKDYDQYDSPFITDNHGSDSEPIVVSLHGKHGPEFDAKILNELKTAFQVILKEMEVFLTSKLLLVTLEDKLYLERVMQETQSLKFLRCLLFDRKNFMLAKDLLGVIDLQDYKSLCAAMQPKRSLFYSEKLPFYLNKRVAMMGRSFHGNHLVSKEESETQQLRTQHPDSQLTIGFNYTSFLETFPLTFAEEHELVMKKHSVLSLKIQETQSLTVYEEQDNGKEVAHPIACIHVEPDDLRLFLSDRSYLVKEVVNLVGRPYRSGWVDIDLQETVKKDIAIKLVVNQPYPASILKLGAKVQLVPHYTS